MTHERSDSMDSCLKIRMNPLNIHFSDGSDMVVDGNPSLPQVVSSAKPVYEDSPIARPHSAELDEVVYNTTNVSRTSICEPVLPLKLAKKKSSSLELESIDLDSKPSSISDLNIPSLGISPLLGGKLSMDFDSFSLSNTDITRAASTHDSVNSRNAAVTKAIPSIATRVPSVKTGPSKSPELIERIRSIRMHRPDPAADDPLPANLLRVIQFSPNQNELAWISDPEESADEAEQKTSAESPQPSIQEQKEVESVVSVSEDHTASPSNIDTEPAFDCSTRETSPETLNIDEPPKELEVTREVSTHSVTNVTPVSTPDITQLDPVSEADRGRLFMQIKKLQSLRGLPIDHSRNPRFYLILDNGMQTVTTSPLALPSPKFNGTIFVNIGQEFELIVGKDLELIITLGVTMDAVHPPSKKQRSAYPPMEPAVTPTASPSKRTVKSFFSPKRKSKAMDHTKVIQQLEIQDQFIRDEKEHDMQMADYRRKRDLWKGKTGPNGEYARGYLFESHYEQDIYGQARTFSLPLYNEWLSENDAPTPCCDLELNLMFIPRLYGSEALPNSLAKAQKMIKEAATHRHLYHEGYLTQNGGDCGIYRRRWFTLKGPELTAHHEATRKARAVIHMENAVEIIDSQDITPSDHMWCIYQDRSFLIVFRDGEEVSFYADSAEQKEYWVRILQHSMQHCTGHIQGWEDLILNKWEESK